MVVKTSSELIYQELLHVADAVAREKDIEREEVLEAMEMAIQKAGRSKYGHERDIHAHIDRSTGKVTLERRRQVCEIIENDHTQINLDDAKKINPTLQIGDLIIDPLPPIDFGRVAAQTAKQVIVQKVRESERKRQYLEYKDRVGEIINGTVKRVDFGNITIDLGRAEALLQRDELIPRENFKAGDRVRAYLFEVSSHAKGPQLFLSRTHPQFLAKLFTQEVPEIYDNIIEIHTVARDPGSRAKMAVSSKDPGIDPIGTCVGVRGSRVQAVVNELKGEKVDIIPWSSNPATFVVNALAPAEVSKIVLDEESNKIEVVVPDSQLSLAIGRRGQNVRLASQLTRWDIDVLTETEESNKRSEEFAMRTQLFVNALEVEEVVAQLLITEGFATIEEIAQIEIEDLLAIEGFDEELCVELQKRAQEFLSQKQKAIQTQYKELEIQPEIMNLKYLNSDMVLALGKNNVKTLDNLADLSTDELLDIVGSYGLSKHKANEVIMAARAHWFEKGVE